MAETDNSLQRAVLFARCSTEEESQKDALKQQVKEGKSCIQRKNWILVDQYVEAVSGTVASKRDEYQRLLRDMDTDKFDIIVIKCLDRLMRETKEWFYFCDRLLKKNKKLYLYLNGRFYNPEEDNATLLSGIEAIMAEQYSRNLSRKVNNAHRNRQESGDTVVLTSRTYGYYKKNKQVLIDEKQAEGVREMFRYCKMGYGGRIISRILAKQGYLNAKGNPFGESSIRRMIRNPLYKGVAVMNKKHYDFNRKCTVNNPPEEWIFREGLVPAIVDEETWEAANREMDQRLQKVKAGNIYRKGSAESVHQFSGKIVCGLCKSPYYKTTRRKYKDGQLIIEWKCSRYLYNGRKNPKYQRKQLRKIGESSDNGCDNVHLQENMLLRILEKVRSQIYEKELIDQEGIIKDAIEILRNVLNKEDDNVQKKKRLERLLQEKRTEQDRLLELLLKGTVSEEIYTRKNKELTEDIQKAENDFVVLEQKNKGKIQMEERLNIIEKRLKSGLVKKATTYQMLDEIEQIEVFPDYLNIRFYGLSIMGLTEYQQNINSEFKDQTDKLFLIKVPLDFPKETERGRQKEKEEILKLVQDNPRLTARKMAEALRLDVSSVRRRIVQLRKDGRLEFVGKGGHGYWIVKKN